MWARKRHRGSANPIIALLVTLLAVFGALVAVLAVKERSIAEGGAIVDGWIAKGVAMVREQAPQAAADATETAGDAAQAAGDNIQASANQTAEKLKGG